LSDIAKNVLVDVSTRGGERQVYVEKLKNNQIRSSRRFLGIKHQKIEFLSSHCGS